MRYVDLWAAPQDSSRTLTFSIPKILTYSLPIDKGFPGACPKARTGDPSADHEYYSIKHAVLTGETTVLYTYEGMTGPH